MRLKQQELGVAVIGLGVGEQHARAYLATGSCQLRFLYDRDIQKTERLIQTLGAGVSAPDFEEILKDPAVQAVSVASNDDDHFEQALALLKAGKHLFVEKPLCRSLEELRALREAWEAAGRPHLVSNLVLRTAPLYRWLKKAVQEGELGELFAFDGDYLYGRVQKITDGWRKDVENYSVMQGGGVHLVDLMLWLTGQKPSRVHAAGNRIATRGTAFRYNDYAAATYRFPSGMIGRVSANFGCMHWHQHVVRLFGTEGTFVYDDAGARLHQSRDPSSAPEIIGLDPLPATKGDLIPRFVNAILNNETTDADTEHEFDVISACVAADNSLAAGDSVPVEYR